MLFPNLDGTGRSIAIDLLEPIKLNASAAPHEYFSVYHSSGTFQVDFLPPWFFRLFFLFVFAILY